MHKQFQILRADLVAQFPERATVIDGSLAAVLAGEHVLLIGPPGTAKSALVRSIAQAFSGSYFERLLTKFSTPEELFGPISLKALEQDRFVRVTAAKLPETEFAFVDEIFKSNSAVLNSLLSIVNERVFHNDGVPMQCPLVSLFGASNELPDGRELEALFDRFLLRFDVQYLLVASNLRGVLTGPEPAITTQLTMDELRRAQAEVAAVKITDDAIDALLPDPRRVSRRRHHRERSALEEVPQAREVLGVARWREQDLSGGPRDPRRQFVARAQGALEGRAHRRQPRRSSEHAERRDPRRGPRDRDEGLVAQDRRPQSVHLEAAQAVEQFDQQQAEARRAGEVGRTAREGRHRRRCGGDPGSARRGRTRGVARSRDRAAEPAVKRRIIYDVPKWSLYMHRAARGLHRADASDTPSFGSSDELFERLFAGEVESLADGDRDMVFADWAQRVHDTVAQLPAFERLAAECRGRADESAMAVEALINELRPDGEDDELRRSARTACSNASAAVEQLRDAMEGLEHVSFEVPGTAGTTTGMAGHPNGNVRSLAARLRDDARLRQIANLAGRFKRIAGAKRRSRVRHGADEIVDVEQGADLGRLLPLELAQLVHPGTQLLALRNLVERQCMQYRLEWHRDARPRTARRRDRQVGIDVGSGKGRMGDGGRARVARPGADRAPSVRVAGLRRRGQARVLGHAGTGVARDRPLHPL